MEPINVNIQSSICIRGSKVMYFDPLEVEAKHDADYIFITHPHFDHFSLLAILEVKKDNTVFITPKDIVEGLLSIGIQEEYIIVVKPNQEYVFKNIEFKTIPAYNLHKKNHRKEDGWVSYLVTLDKVVYYIAGDTDITEENKSVKANIIFIPIGGTYTMDIHDAYKLTKCINPDRVIPTHYGSIVGNISDGFKFKELVKDEYKCELYIK